MKYKIIDETSDHKYFTIIPNYILNHASANDIALYNIMKKAAGEDGLCFMTEETMCKKLGIGDKSLHKSLKYLLDNKWIKYVGVTPSKTRPIKTYKMLDIWKQNVDFYKDKKIPSESGVSKDTRQKRDKIPVEKRGIRRSIIKKNKTSDEPRGSGFNSIGSLLKKHDKQILKASAIPSKIGGAFHRWQDTAVRWWIKLGLGKKPTASWFKIFKQNAGLAERACSWASDSGGKDLEKLTYWALNQFKKHGKIVYNKTD